MRRLIDYTIEDREERIAAALGEAGMWMALDTLEDGDTAKLWTVKMVDRGSWAPRQGGEVDRGKGLKHAALSFTIRGADVPCNLS